MSWQQKSICQITLKQGSTDHSQRHQNHGRLTQGSWNLPTGAFVQGFIYLSSAPILRVRSLSLVAFLLQSLLLDHLQNLQYVPGTSATWKGEKRDPEVSDGQGCLR